MLFVFQGTENTLGLNEDQKVLLRSSLSQSEISAALLEKLSFGMGMLQQGVTNCCHGHTVHTVPAAPLSVCGGSW